LRARRARLSIPGSRPGYTGSHQSAQPLVLLAGLLCDELIWAEVAARLADRASVQIVDFPNLASIGAMAERVLEVAPVRFALAGHSMGGRVALEVVRRAPDRVRGLALLNTGVHPLRDGEVANRGELVRIAREQGMTAVAAAWLPPMMGATPARVAQLLPLLTAMVERATPESFAGQIQALLERPNAQAVLASISVPTLLVSGTRDTWSPVEQHRDMQRQIPQATLVAINDAGHLAPIEQPAAVAAALREWLGRL
jgi:pimeloyl-ACP methyl ester carboxylesterase